MCIRRVLVITWYKGVEITILCFGKGERLFYISIKPHNVVKIQENPRRLSVQPVKIQEPCSEHGSTPCSDFLDRRSACVHNNFSHLDFSKQPEGSACVALGKCGRQQRRSINNTHTLLRSLKSTKTEMLTVHRSSKAKSGGGKSSHVTANHQSHDLVNRWIHFNLSVSG